MPNTRIDEVLDVVKLDTQAAVRPVRTYSTGMRQRLLIARALLNPPPILLLDEPTRGLDPITARELRELIVELSHGGTTIVLTTHMLEEADHLCDRIAFLRNGRLVALVSPRMLKQPSGASTAEVLLDNDLERHQLQLDDVADAELLRGWMSMGRVRAIHSREPTLEDVFVRLAHSPEVDDNISGAVPKEPSAVRTNAIQRAAGRDRIRGNLNGAKRWGRIVSRLSWQELCGTVRNGQWLLLALLLAAAGSCNALRSSAEHSVVRVAYAADRPTDVVQKLATSVDQSITIEFTSVQSIDSVREAVDQQRASVGLVFPADLDTALKQGQTPAITIVHRARVGADTTADIAALTPALQEETGQAGPAQILEDARPAAARGLAGVVERLDALGLFAVFSLMLLLTVIGTTIVSKLLHEEVDKKTLSALLLVATPVQVLVGKGLTGLVYVLLALPFAVAVSGLPVAEPALVAIIVALFGVWLVELGLMLGLAVDRSSYKGLGPVVSLAVLLGIVAIAVGSSGFAVGAIAWPSVAASWLLLDALTGVSPYTAGAWAAAVLVGWVALSFAVLLALLEHREL